MPLTTYTAGEVLSAASLNSNLTSAAASGGLVCVKAETAFSAVASVTADGVFTSGFSNYFMTLAFQTSGNVDINFRLRAGGVDTSTNYNLQHFFGTGAVEVSFQTVAATSCFIATTNGAFPSYATVQFSNPQNADKTNFIVNCTQSSGAQAVSASVQVAGNQNSITQFDGINIFVASGTTTGTFAIYGYQKTIA